MTDQATIDKIAKLLALAEGQGATPSEAANAAAAAQALMQRHKLTRTTVEAKSAASDPIEEKEDDPLWMGGRYVSWVGELADNLARINGCRVIVTPAAHGFYKQKARLHLVGREDDMAVVRYLFAYLRREIDRLARKAVREAVVRNPRTWAQNFRMGAVVAVARRLKAAKQEATERARTEQGEEATTQALVHLDSHEAAIQKWVEDRFPGKGYRAEGHATVDTAGLLAGVQEGKRIPLRDGLSEGTEIPALDGGKP